MAINFPAQAFPDLITSVQSDGRRAVTLLERPVPGVLPSAADVTRIFIVSEHAIHRAALSLLLAGESGFQVIGAAADSEGAFHTARSSADVVLLDLATPLPSDAGGFGSVARACAPAQVILLVPALDKTQLLTALAEGVRGVLTKDVASGVLFRSIRAVAAGQCWIGREAVAELVESVSEMARSGGPVRPQMNFGLSTRELDIVAAVAAGCVNKEIARRFAISEKTVKHHLSRVFDKLGLSNRLEVALFALREGLVERSSIRAADY